ncbi:hypothetical protein GM661_12190 [Iocasia frigidifontis]|uniref:Uncharacterized protein n=1 Tax=Iocasia fonsfrigidae TaxID=2682810 RepID=A0A8A7KG43_9FIRM|nr:hypothetical protein [Iocasia fonsfrigidae]QTL98668.1 hypothetical protein GM661_12190 [Iocasia fonsfrigidae]
MNMKARQGKTYATAHDLKFDNFEFKSLNKLEIEKSIYDHSRVLIEGVINENDIKEYNRYLEQEDPPLVITYDSEDKQLVIFKGIVSSYKIVYKNQVYCLQLRAFSYSILLTRERRNRIYQNLGSRYNDVLNILNNENKNFYFSCSTNQLGETVFISKDYPLVLQYKESDWDFIKRISSYINQPVIVDDTKDNSETINIQIGSHISSEKKLSNTYGEAAQKTGKKSTKYNYFKIEEYKHSRTGNVFNVGVKLDYITDNEKQETIELVIIENNIYIDKSNIYSEIVLAKEENIRILNIKRRFEIEGRGFRAEVMSLSPKHQAKVSFLDIEDDFEESKAHWFPLDQVYRDVFSAPELGDIVDIYFKSKNERHAAVRESLTEIEQEVKNDPVDKIIITPEGFQIKINNDSIFVIGKGNISTIEIAQDLIKAKQDDNDLNINLNKDLIQLNFQETKFALNDSAARLASGGTGLIVDDSKIDLA